MHEMTKVSRKAAIRTILSFVFAVATILAVHPLAHAADDMTQMLPAVGAKAPDFTLLADVNHEVTSQYGSVMQMNGNTIAARNTFVINPKGMIVKVYQKVSPTPHSAQVLADLADLQKEQ